MDTTDPTSRWVRIKVISWQLLPDHCSWVCPFTFVTEIVRTLPKSSSNTVSSSVAT
uniref:4Fe-4S binding protein n=1 Tax=Paenibacillus alba TaxID=1197127 RepID=UPI00398AACAD